MKKIIAILLSILCVACLLCGCGGNAESTPDSEQEVQKHMVSDEVITDAFLSYRYSIGGFSITLRELLPKCCPDYSGSFATYEETKTEHLDQEDIDAFESGEYKQYLSNAYIVTIGGPIMENPDIPYLVTEEETILKLLIIFDENDSVVGYSLIEACSQLKTCATLVMF